MWIFRERGIGDILEAGRKRGDEGRERPASEQ